MEKLASKLAGIKTVAIAGHVRPDGDCIGSCMGLYLYLKENELDIKCDVYLKQQKKDFLISKIWKKQNRNMIHRRNMTC